MFRRIFLILLAIGIVAVGLYFAFKVKKQETVYGSLSTESIGKVNAILERDADGDGLKDWEEELWQTGRDTADSDGDGSADGIEVSSGRNPLKAGPGDALDEKTLDEKTTLNQQGEPTLTDIIARDLFARYLQLKQEGRPLDAEDERQLLLQFFNNPLPLEAVVLYTLADLRVLEEQDTESLREYGNKLARIFKKYANKGTNELNILTDAVEREDGSILKELDERIDVYKGMRDELLVLEVPAPLSQNHVDLLNAMNGIVQSVSGMKFAISDPARALGSIGAYPHSFELLANTFAEMKRVFTAQGVIFGSSEPGKAIME